MAHATTRVRRCYLVRHAIAAPRGAAWPDDDERPLTRAGIERMTRAVQGLRALDVEVDVVLTSPLVRARQTADLLAAGLDRRPRLLALAELAPGVAPDVTMRAVARATRAASVALVGHEPDLGTLAAWLIGAREPVPFRKGGVCRIDVGHWPAAPRGRLVWFAPPKMLRHAGRSLPAGPRQSRTGH